MGSCLSFSEERPAKARPGAAVPDAACAFIRLPVDILLLIIHALRADLAREKQLAQMRTLTAVCTTLRSIVLHEPSFWQCIYVRGARAVHDLSYGMLRGRNTSVELGIDFSERRGPHPIDECSALDVLDSLALVAKHMHRVRVLSISLDFSSIPALKLLSAEGPILEEFHISVFRAARFASDTGPGAGSLHHIFSGVAPRLRILSISGLYFPIIPAGMMSSLQTVTLRGSLLPSSNLRHLLSSCSSTLRDLDLRNCRMVNEAAPDFEKHYPLALTTLSLDGVEEFRFDPTMHRSHTMVLEALYWSTMGANARQCFDALPTLKTLELIRNPPYNDSLPGVVIHAETESGMKRSIVCYFPDSPQGRISPVVLAVTGARTVRFLVLTLEWIDEFMQHSPVLCGLVEELTLVHGWDSKFYYSTTNDNRHGRAFPLLRRIVLDVYDAEVGGRILNGVKIVLRRLISSPEWWEEMLEVKSRSDALME